MRYLYFNTLCFMGFVFFNISAHAEDYSEYACSQSGRVLRVMFMKHQLGQTQDQFNEQTDFLSAKKGLVQTFRNPKIGEAYGSFLQSSFNEAFSQPKIQNFSQRMEAAEQFRQNKVVQCKQKLSDLAYEIAKTEVAKTYASRTGVKSIYGPYKGGFDDIFNYDVSCNNTTSGSITTDYKSYGWRNYDKNTTWHNEYNISVKEAAQRICSQ